MAVSIVSSSISKRLVYLSAAFPVVTFLAEWSRGFDYLIFRHLADDAFYYFEVSRHIPEVNVGVPTTGFHPLYAFLASPLHRNLDYTLAVPLSLLILILAYATSTLLVHEVL